MLQKILNSYKVGRFIVSEYIYKDLEEKEEKEIDKMIREMVIKIIDNVLEKVKSHKLN